ncbi:MAG: nitrite/sulfite reductase, partial [Okeania sp. SIO1H5]|nr:nitrite/sulfite reductase [Okeania sp. SIO1H5]
SLTSIGLEEPGAGTIVDIVACPGTDTCKLGVASSRGLGAELRHRLAAKAMELDESVRGLTIKVSGCFNGCAQQYVCDIGFYGISRNVSGYVVPHFQMILGGEAAHNGENYGLPVGGIPSKAIPDAVEKVAELYLENREKGETFRQFVERVKKPFIMTSLKEVIQVPAYEEDKSYYVDWADVREFSVKDRGMGECAGEVVSLTDFGLKAADREIFDAQVKLDEGNIAGAGKSAYQAMAYAAQALIKRYNIDISDDHEAIFQEFKERFYDTETFFDPFAGPKFALFYLRAHEVRSQTFEEERTTHLIQEAQLFIEASHSCYTRLMNIDPAEQAV